jgi:hypothetical protein
MNCHGIRLDPYLAKRNQGLTTSAQPLKCLITFLVTASRCIKYVQTQLQVHCNSLSCLCLPLLTTLLITKLTINQNSMNKRTFPWAQSYTTGTSPKLGLCSSEYKSYSFSKSSNLLAMFSICDIPCNYRNKTGITSWRDAVSSSTSNSTTFIVRTRS